MIIAQAGWRATAALDQRESAPRSPPATAAVALEETGRTIQAAARAVSTLTAATAPGAGHGRWARRPGLGLMTAAGNRRTQRVRRDQHRPNRPRKASRRIGQAMLRLPPPL